MFSARHNRDREKAAQALPDLSFRLDNGRPQPPLPADWKAAFRGSRVEAQLRSGHVMTSLLDFPSKAGDFLDGMVRAQIDRLTPWTANDAVFGWSPPVPAANDRIDVTFAATSKQKVQPLLQFAQALDVASVAIYATASAGAEHLPGSSCSTSRGEAQSAQRRRDTALLRVILLATAACRCGFAVDRPISGVRCNREQDELQRQIAQRRAALRLDANAQDRV